MSTPTHGEPLPNQADELKASLLAIVFLRTSAKTGASTAITQRAMAIANHSLGNAPSTITATEEQP